MQDYRTKTDGFDEGSVPRIPDQMQDKQISLYNHTESTACENPSFTEAELAEIQILKTQLVASGLNSFYVLFFPPFIFFSFLSTGFQQQLCWIQKSLLVACSARLGTYVNEEFRNPVACLSLKMRLPCPIIPWTEVQASALNSNLFRLLLHRMGLLTSVAQTVPFPRIPFAWSAETLYRAALFLGPVDSQNIDFDLQCLTKVELQVPPCHINSPADG